MPEHSGEAEAPDDGPGRELSRSESSLVRSWTAQMGDSPERSVRRTITQTKMAQLYKETPLGRFAKSPTFEYTTLSVISANAIWLGIDTDLNHATNFHDTHKGFIVVENLFCLYFAFELGVRFFARRIKASVIRDAWFVFDSLLAVLMVLETWIAPWAFGSGGTALDDLNALRLLRLLRLARLARLLRAVPEMLTIVKGIIAATRSVASVLLFLLVLVYVFAIVFTSQYAKQFVGRSDLTEDEELLQESWSSLGMSMFTLICIGTFLDDVAGLVKAIREDSIVYLAIFFSFIALSAFTVLNMLIGILCEVVQQTSEIEHEKVKLDIVSVVVTDAFKTIDVDGSGKVSKVEFEQMCGRESVLETLETELGIDGMSLREMGALIFDKPGADQEKVELTFDDFLNVLVRLRPMEEASLLDVQQFQRATRDQERLVMLSVERLREQVDSLRDFVNGKPIPRRSLSSRQDRSPRRAPSGTPRWEVTDIAGFIPGAAEEPSIPASPASNAEECKIASPRPSICSERSEMDCSALLAEASDDALMQELRKRFGGATALRLDR
eukprot:TRINITY_DN53495_c0_g1_i2.p1 TRINITY_DN53495_c0_g1~~TRINITY_DN53495_c0_g1_i2.p1  ORF type:complete len:555 (+),score=108.73 TRINITY_DN53495_c0_g1_i2:87-1751(+)